MIDKKIVYISAGTSHSLAVTDDKHVYSCGWNTDGQLGHGDLSPRDKPELIEELIGENIVKVEALCSCSIAFASDGAVYGWGWNDYGQIGFKDNKSRRVPEKIPDLKIDPWAI